MVLGIVELFGPGMCASSKTHTCGQCISIEEEDTPGTLTSKKKKGNRRKNEQVREKKSPEKLRYR